IVIDYKTEQFEDKLSDVDVVLDTQGGPTLERSFRVLKQGGRIVTVGGKPDGKFAKSWGLNPILVAILSFMARKTTRLAKHRDAHFEYLFMRADGEELRQIGALIEQGVIKPVIDKTYPLSEGKEALAYVESGRAVGKVVIEMG